MNKNSHGVVSLLIISVLVLIGIAGFAIFQSRISAPKTPSVNQEKNGGLANLPRDEDLRGWKTYQSDTFEFKYPKDWVIQENPLTLTDPTDTLIVSISSFNPAVVGISYCEAYPEDTPRCEQLSLENGTAIIDWGGESTSNANVILFEFITVSLEVSPDIPAEPIIDSETKNFFRLFLSTFRFLPSDCGECPQYSPPSADFCKDGEIISGRTDECGCQLPPTCKKSPPEAADGCVIGGCSGEICAEEEMFSTCILKPEAICYQSATCERQANGSCGWTQTEELTACLAEYQ